MKWKKFGRCEIPADKPDWIHSHASVPFAEVIDTHHVRVWFSARDAMNRSQIGYGEIDMRQPTRLVTLSETPVLGPGRTGTFDDSGALLSWIASAGDRRYLYYVGWNLGVTVPFRNAIGLAWSDGKEPFRRMFEGPIVDRTRTEPHFTASCCVLPGETFWRLWYVSCVGWDLVNGTPRHRYLIRYAESDDGIDWRRDGAIAIGFGFESEYAISRPSVLCDDGLWRMWYSVRGESYRIGYAESQDGRTWQRQDALAGIDVSDHGWDSEMIEYPHVFDLNGQRYMLYNGNGYGRTGFGLAVLEQE